MLGLASVAAWAVQVVLGALAGLLVLVSCAGV
jgi:hypothetical protein